MTIVRAMSAAIKLNECYDEPSGEKLPPRARAENSNSCGGNVDEILKRLGKVESTLLETREQVIGIAATIPHLATKVEVREVRTEISQLRTELGGIAAIIPHLATRADVTALEVRLIKWMVGTVIASAGLVFTITRFVH
jgi:hypothetical protein